MKGIIANEKRKMSDEQVIKFLKQAEIAHVATVDNKGYPYVIPLIYFYDGKDKIYIHTGNLRKSHFVENIKENPKVSIEVCEMGDIHPGKKYACQSALVYRSVVVFGQIKKIDEDAKKEWFFDRLLEKYGNPEWNFEKGYPALPKIDLFEIQIEKMTGKLNEGFRH
ncbi:pyridoxamine 5'-phosphate oxidase family protein [Caldibacillus thermolactis]|uniref:Pyridoxamine 5'-phosphate oxidase family protein n=1 Tax=Pallidibacillus thermolactis TaxID=251051 RepID=A0ABT2WI82_9BACI|nr:pyridoxamine 5'-phosphate oxidase family protein [Pallidibacillus thermolactis]MCU9595404.1 pyridoxamine 5'-phosphate oxidase family protein [Pallidibacillus thermolactis]